MTCLVHYCAILVRLAICYMRGTFGGDLVSEQDA